MPDIPPGYHYRRGGPTKKGYRKSTIVRNPRRRKKHAHQAPAIPTKGRTGLAASIAITATIGAVALTTTLSGSGGSSSLNVQVKADLAQSIAVLSKLGYTNMSNTSFAKPTGGSDCAASASGQVRLFLSHHNCKEYATAETELKGNGIATPVVITWVVMPTPTLAGRYQSLADKLGYGNPPGQSPAFTGRCYASGQNGQTVWAEQVQPTGHVDADRQILQAMAPVQLTPNYLEIHCAS